MIKKISYIQNMYASGTETRISRNLIPEFNKRGIDIIINDCDDECEFILSINGLSQLPHIREISDLHPSKKVILYVWDLYPWTQYAKDYDWINAKEIVEIWVPSQEVSLRLNEIYNVPASKTKVVKCYAEFFEDTNNVSSNRDYVYHFARDYKDPNFEFTNKACDDLNIPYIRSTHNLDFEEYKNTVLKSSFLVTEYMEASTGGLTLIEGYYHGKNILISDSIYQGARDYFGDRAYYFKDGDIEDFKAKVKMLWELKEDVDLKDRRQFCQQYTIESMMDRILKNLNSLKWNLSTT
jgi:hypothetical protein